MEEKIEKIESTNLTSWEEAEKQDKLNSKFFNVESNMKFRLTFSEKPMEDADVFDNQCITGRLVKKAVPVWENNQKTDKTEEKFVLQLVIDSLDGEPCMKMWNCKNKKMRGLFRTYAENNLLTKKVFVVEVQGELMKQNYSVVALDKKGKADKTPYVT